MKIKGKGKNVTHWAKAINWLSKIGLHIAMEDDGSITFFKPIKIDMQQVDFNISSGIQEPPQKIPMYFTTIKFATYMDWYKNNRDAFENVAFFAKSKLADQTP